VPARAPARRSGPAAGDRAVDRAHQQVDPSVVGGEEALLLVGEVLVEAAAGDARAVDHVGDRHARLALLRHRLGHGEQHPAALGLGDHLARRRVAAAGKDRGLCDGTSRRQNCTIETSAFLRPPGSE
jgi:hypothetical protein